MQTEVLLRFHQVPDIARIEIYRRCGGYQALAKAARMNTDAIIEIVGEAGLRGRGGAGFPTAVKWRQTATNATQPHYLICNVAEGEPGSFKDRELLKNPHQVLEACAIAAYAVGANTAYIYLRGAFKREEVWLKQALLQARNQKLIGDGGLLPVQLIIHRGEDSYIAGEETAMIESLEGKPAIPRTKPPRPHESGLFDSPTVVNNVETICNLIPILLHGAGGFRSVGTEKSPGTKLFCLSGRIRRPGIYELPLGTQLSELLMESGGGPLDGRRLIAVFPGGPSTPIVPVDLDPALDFEGLQSAGSALGTGGVIVIDDSVNIRGLAVEVSGFFARENCEACPPCTYGTTEIHKLFQTIAANQKDSRQEILKIRELCEMMKFRGQCAHNRTAALTALSLLDRFPEYFRQPGGAADDSQDWIMFHRSNQ